MANSKKQNEDPAEGSRETIERELEKEDHYRTKPPDRITEDDLDRIRARAYEIWEREGRPDGGHERHWHQAQKELEEEGRISPHAGE
ncbi:DUF2934 domain-containing protein [Sinorhizobium meliloti]|uniref:DUF2934 domain-containing protein n=1 Tax=Rhizobium meliloti TaxID=382 RepID=UPI002091DDA8|nr:DUF2934 domain-containing protein [Sinorhizobium meliloti]MCO5963686.1 DUF2934 domain-containing protein [Sinorhizobium meliloti]